MTDGEREREKERESINAPLTLGLPYSHPQADRMGDDAWHICTHLVQPTLVLHADICDTKIKIIENYSILLHLLLRAAAIVPNTSIMS